MSEAQELGELYAVGGGRIGSHVLIDRSAHGRAELHNRIRELIRHGFSKLFKEK